MRHSTPLHHDHDGGDNDHASAFRIPPHHQQHLNDAGAQAHTMKDRQKAYHYFEGINATKGIDTLRREAQLSRMMHINVSAFPRGARATFHTRDDDAPQIEYRLCSLFSGGAFFLSFFPAWMDVERGTGIRH